MRTASKNPSEETAKPVLPGQVVLVLQGGGALGAYQVGVYEALHEAGIEPDWVIGTSIGAINGALIVGNPPEQRLERLHAFWESVAHSGAAMVSPPGFPKLANAWRNWMTIVSGIPSFFTPNPLALFGQQALVGIENAAYYSTAPLRNTLEQLVDLDYLNARHARLSLGAVKICSGEMVYFDSRKHPLTLDHIMASGAFPPAFPAVCVDGDYYWDGGIYSNTPLEAVLDDNPRHDSLIFTVDIWNPDGAKPESLWEVAAREKDIQYASRAHSHIARQKQIHHLRHVINELTKAIPEKQRASAEIKALAAWGCKTTMHVVRLVASTIEGEDQLKDIDFAPDHIRLRRDAGYADTKRMLDLAPWAQPVDPIEGVIIHDSPSGSAPPLAKGIDGFKGKTK
jgi:NTE family protein